MLIEPFYSFLLKEVTWSSKIQSVYESFKQRLKRILNMEKFKIPKGLRCPRVLMSHSKIPVHVLSCPVTTSNHLVIQE